VPVTIMYEARFKSIIRQKYDFSCGSAALASLLTHHYGRPTTETQVFREMWKTGDQASIKKLGFSLLDMKRYLEAHGLHADGFRIGLDKLKKVGIPAITLIDSQGYKHFVVIKGVRENEVLLGDPALGTTIVPRKDFEKVWQGVVFVIRDEYQVGRKHFNMKRDWSVRAKAPVATARRNDAIGAFQLSLPGRNEF
jgi:predicted double-glycine peptidase